MLLLSLWQKKNGVCPCLRSWNQTLRSKNIPSSATLHVQNLGDDDDDDDYIKRAAVFYRV